VDNANNSNQKQSTLSASPPPPPPPASSAPRSNHPPRADRNSASLQLYVEPSPEGETTFEERALSSGEVQIPNPRPYFIVSPASAAPALISKLS